MIATAGTAVTVAFVILAVSGGGRLAGVDVSPLAAAAAAGAAALGASLRPQPATQGRAGKLRPLAPLAVLLAVPAVSAVAAAGRSPVAMLVAVAGVVALDVAVNGERGLAPAGMVAIGLGLALAGFVAADPDPSAWTLTVSGPAEAAFVTAGGAVVVLAGALARDPRLLARVAVVPGALLAVTAVPHVDGLAAAAVLAGGGAAVAAALRQPAAGAALVGLAAAATPATEGAALLLLAGAVLAVPLRPPWAGAPLLPGAVALTFELAWAPVEGAGVVVAVGAAVVAMVMAAVPGGRLRLRAGHVPAVGLGAWLVLAPGSWTWAGPPELEAYEVGVTRAAAAGLLAVVATAAAVPLRRRLRSRRGAEAG